MPLARTYNAATGKVVTTARDGFLDRLSRNSDIKEYLPFLFETAASYPEVRVLELGTRRGNSTLAFLAAAEAMNGHVTSVDLDLVTHAADGMLPWRNCPGWTFIHGDDLDEAVQAKLPAEVDVLFIDTSHEYEHTLQELRAYMPRVAPKGVALFHDTMCFGTWDKGNDTGIPSVARALDAYCAETGQTWANLPGEYGLGVIHVREEYEIPPGDPSDAVISVLLPTRGRVDELRAAVDNLRRFAADASLLEIMVAADPDDPDTIAAAQDLGLTLHVAPKRYGYQGLHHYYNYLASVATGEWLMIWNDDCKILTPGWDDVIRRMPPGILHPDIDYQPDMNSFPIVPAEWARLLGHLTVTEGVDLWIHDVGRMTGTMRRIPVKVHHGRRIGDATAADRDARDVRAELGSFNAPAAQQARWADAEKLQELLGRPPLDRGQVGVMVFSLKEPELEACG